MGTDRTLASLEASHAQLLREVDAVVRPLVERLPMHELARHNRGCASYAADPFGWFVLWERRRYLHTVHRLASQSRGDRVLDIGSFIPYLPILLTRLGFTVTIIDRFSFYGDRFADAIAQLADQHGIARYEGDILREGLRSVGQHDNVLLLAVVEHLAGSPRHLMAKVRRQILPGGMLLFEVPNIASLSRRLKLLRGQSPLPAYADYFASDYPFVGHNREMTADEVRYLLERSGFAVTHLETYDFTPRPASTDLSSRARRLLRPMVPKRWARELVYAEAAPSSRSECGGDPGRA